MDIYDKNIKVTTKTGSYYNINRGLFSKNSDGWAAMHQVFFFDIQDLPPTVKGWSDFFEFSKTMPKTFEPEVGKNMFISGRDHWWISTEIVDIEEYPVDD